MRGVREEQARRRVQQTGVSQLGGGSGATDELRVERGSRCFEAYVQAIQPARQRPQIQQDQQDAGRRRAPTTSS